MYHLKKCLFLLVLLLVFTTCKKEEWTAPPENNSSVNHPFDIETPVKERFFSNDYILQANPNLTIAAQSRDQDAFLYELQTVIDYQDDQEGFINDLVDSIGYPVWSQADVMDSMIFVPFVKEDSEVIEALLVVKAENGFYDLKLLLRNRIYNNILAENIHRNFEMELSVFYEYDQRLFDAEDIMIKKALETDYEGFQTESAYR